MESSTVSLKTTQISSTALTAPANTRYFDFSKRFDRAALAEGFAQKAPSQIVTALTVTKIAPAVFFMIEKLASALETLLNRGASLLGCAVSAMDDHEIVVVITSGKAKEAPAAVIEKQPATPTPVKDETTVVEEPASPIKEETPPAVVDEKSATPTPVKDETTVVEEPASPIREETPPAIVDEKPATPAKDETPAQTPAVQPQPEAPKEDGLDKYNDLLIEPKDLSPPAVSNTKRNLLIGAGLAALIGGIGYVASRYFNTDSFDPDTMCGLEEPPPSAEDIATCHPDSGEMSFLTAEDIAACHPNSGETCDIPAPSLLGKLFDIQQTPCHPDSGEMSFLTAEDIATCHPDSGEMCGLPTPEDTATCHKDYIATCMTTTQLLNGEIARMSGDERIQRDILLDSLAHNSSAYEYDENAERCWVQKHDSNNAWWCEQPLCQDAPNGVNDPECLTEESSSFSNEDGSIYAVWKETSGDHCVEVTCNKLFACDHDPVCE